MAAKILTDPKQENWFSILPRIGYFDCPLPKDCKAFALLMLCYNLFQIWIRVDVNEFMARSFRWKSFKAFSEGDTGMYIYIYLVKDTKNLYAFEKL